MASLASLITAGVKPSPPIMTTGLKSWASALRDLRCAGVIVRAVMGLMIEHWWFKKPKSSCFGQFCIDSFCFRGQKLGKCRAKVGKLWRRINLIKVGCRII